MAAGPSFARFSRSMEGRAYWIVLFGAAAFWFALAALIAPNLGDTDIYMFKDAGCNLALGRGFTAIALPGMSLTEPQLFAAYAPGIPLLFGLFASVFGCNAYANTFFDLILATAATLALAWAVQDRIAPRWKVPLALAMGAAMPTGMVLNTMDRPEGLGLVLFVAATALAVSKRKHADLESAAVAGIAMLFYPFGGALAGLAAWALGANRDGAARIDIVPQIRRALTMASVFIVPALIAIAIYAIVDPSALSRFTGHAFGDATGAGAVMHKPFLTLLRHSAFSAGLYSKLGAVGFVAAVLVGGYFFVRLMRQDAQRFWPLAAAAAAFVLVPLIVFPSQNNYLGFVRAALPIVIALAVLPASLTLVRRSVVAVLVAVTSLINLPLLGLTTLIRVQGAQAYDIAHAEAAAFARDVRVRAPDSLVLVPSTVYFLYKPGLGNIANPAFFDAGNPSTAQAAVACYQGQPPGPNSLTRKAVAAPLAQTMRVSGHYIPHLFGRRLTNSEWGWSCDGYLAAGKH